MFLTKNYGHCFAPATEGHDASTAGGFADSGVESESEEDPTDEADIITDQDQTASGDPDSNDEYLGADGSDRPPLENSEAFEKGRRDVKDQLDRNIRAMNSATGRAPNDSIMEDEIEMNENSEDNEDQSYIVSTSAADFDEKTKDEFRDTQRGHATGAFTDIGEGRSSVTRRHVKPKPSDNRH